MPFTVVEATNPIYQTLKQDILINADYWFYTPKIIGAGLGFTQILGVPGVDTTPAGQQAVIDAGGAWETLSTTNSNPALRAYTSATTPQGMAIGYGKAIVGGGGMPVEFSWPVLPSTVDGSDFEVTLNTGKKVIAQAASINPNLEYNERSTVVVVSPFFGNRTFPGQRGSVYPVKLRIVRDATPLKLVGPRGQIKVAVGMTYGDGKTPMSGYHSGPKLCAAKLSRLSTSGEGGPAVYTTGYSPNDGVSLYGANAQYRLRVLTTGGFSPDGVRSLYPTEYSDFFKIEVKDADGRLFYLTKSNKTYHLKAGSIKILGLADLSIAQQSYDDSYVEDHDNQIDIILQGDEAAMKRIKNVLVPSSSPYKPFYNPGGPGNNPTRGVTYTKPSPSINQAVTIAIDNPMTVNYLGAQ